jgi:hypothetical protein
MDLGTDGKRLVVEIIATLVHIKSTMVTLLLRPAGVPEDVYRPLLYRRDEATGRILSKRQIAPPVLDQLDAAKNVGSCNGAELATNVVEKGKSLITLVK